MIKIGIIGGGNMGTAILSRMPKSKFPVTVSEKNPARSGFLKRKYKIRTASIRDLLKTSRVIILAVKPQDFDGVLQEIKTSVSKRHLVISIAAGITSSYIEKKLGKGVRVIRAMPNLPAMIGEGITAVARGKFAGTGDLRQACQIFNHVGKAVIAQEKDINAITAVSGSGPAYLFYFAECLSKAARSLGLNQEMSRQLVKSTILGSARLLDQSKDDAGTLRIKVTSKGGTTQAAMDVLMKNQVEKIFLSALKAAKNRAKKLAK